MRHFKQLDNTIYGKAFTLVEIIIVVAIMGVALQVLTGILFTIMRQQSAVIRFSNVKKEGDQVMERMKSEIYKRTINITDSAGVPVCVTSSESAANMTTGYFVDSTPISFRFSQSGNYIVYRNNGVNSNLNTSKTSISGLTVQCKRLGTYSNRLIMVSFTIQSSVVALASEGNPTLRYNTLIMLKN
ncbi:MAG: type II secretion system protein [Patescibacteria group bacterium]